MTSTEIREEQVQRNRERFGSENYPGGNVPGDWPDFPKDDS